MSFSNSCISKVAILKNPFLPAALVLWTVWTCASGKRFPRILPVLKLHSLTLACPSNRKKNVLHIQMSDFRMGGILGKRFPEAQVHTVHRTSAAGFMSFVTVYGAEMSFLNHRSRKLAKGKYFYVWRLYYMQC